MATYSQDQIDAIFRKLGLATERDRRRFQFRQEAEVPPSAEDVQVFIRTQANTVNEEERDNAKLA